MSEENFPQQLRYLIALHGMGLDDLISLFSQVVDDLSYDNMPEKRFEALSIINEHLENHR